MVDPTLRPDRYLPLKPPVLSILLVLADGEAHGYRIKKEVEALSHGALHLQPGTLYRLLARLLDDGMAEESKERPDPELDDQRRRYYRLTELGLAVVEAETARLAALVDAARAKKLIKTAS